MAPKLGTCGLVVFLLAILFASTSYAFVIGLNISPTTGFSYSPKSVDFGEISTGSTRVITIQNDGNTPLNVFVYSPNTQKVQVQLSGKSSETNNEGPSCKSEYSLWAGKEEAQVCSGLGYADSADLLGIVITLTPAPGAKEGTYPSSVEVRTKSDYEGKSVVIPISYTIGKKSGTVNSLPSGVESAAKNPASLLFNSVASALQISSAMVSSVTLVVPVSALAVIIFAAILVLLMKKR